MKCGQMRIQFFLILFINFYIFIHFFQLFTYIACFISAIDLIYKMKTIFKTCNLRIEDKFILKLIEMNPSDFILNYAWI